MSGFSFAIKTAKRSIQPFEFQISYRHHIPLFHALLFQLVDDSSVFEHFLEKGKGFLGRDGDVLDEEIHKTAVHKESSVRKAGDGEFLISLFFESGGGFCARGRREFIHLAFHDFEELIQPFVRDGTDGINLLARSFSEAFHGIFGGIGDEIGLGSDDDLGSVCELFAVRGELRPYLDVILVRVSPLASRHIHHMDDEAHPFDVAEEIIC